MFSPGACTATSYAGIRTFFAYKPELRCLLNTMSKTGRYPSYYTTDSKGRQYREYGVKGAEFGHEDRLDPGTLVQEGLAKALSPLQIRRLYVVCKGVILMEEGDEHNHLYKVWNRVDREEYRAQARDEKRANRERWIANLHNVLRVLEHREQYPGPPLEGVLMQIARTKEDVQEDILYYEEQLRDMNAS